MTTSNTTSVQNPVINFDLGSYIKEHIPAKSNKKNKKITNKKTISPWELLPTTNLNDLGEDGVDHININERSKTRLGLLFSNQYYFKQEVGPYGKFSSIKRFWTWVTSVERPDEIRHLHTSKLSAFTKSLTKCKVVNFKVMIAEAMYHKVSKLSELKKLLLENDLPFECYYVDAEGNKSRYTFSKWIIYIANIIQTALKEDKKPDFIELYDDPKNPQDLYYDFNSKAFSTDPLLEHAVKETEGLIASQVHKILEEAWLEASKSNSSIAVLIIKMEDYIKDKLKYLPVKEILNPNITIETEFSENDNITGYKIILDLCHSKISKHNDILNVKINRNFFE